MLPSYTSIGRTIRMIAIALTLAAVPLPAAVWTGPANAQSVDRLRGVAEPVLAKKPYRLGFAAVHFVDNFWNGVTYGIADEAEKSGAVLVSTLSAGGYGNLSEQISNLETLSARNLDGIIIAGATYDGLDRTVKRLTDSGIKVVVAATPINAKTASVGILEDEHHVGEQMGDYICALKPGAKVITLPGPQGSEWNKIRFDGFQSAAKKCNLQTYGNTFQGQISLEDGQKQATDLLIKYPDAQYVWGVAGLIGDGAAAAVRRLDRKEVKVVTSAFTQDTVSMMKQGYTLMTVSEPAVLTGRLAMQYMVRLLNGDPLPNTTKASFPYPIVSVPTAVVEAKDIGSYDLNDYDWPPTGWKNPFSQ
jgi:ABC-type sugar transport system substrate-binding protein